MRAKRDRKGIGGRRPKPAEQKELTGSKYVKPGDVDREPTPRGEVRKPPGLSKEAARVWDYYEAELIRLKLLRALDVHLFAQLCELIAELSFCSREDRTAAKLRALQALGGQFGIGPGERARIGLNLGKQQTPQEQAAERAQREAEERGDEPAAPVASSIAHAGSRFFRH